MDWKELFEEERSKEYWQGLQDFVEEQYASAVVYPPKDDLYTAFDLTPLESIKCVILGQDPYHGRGQAHGLAFSVRPDIAIPKSLMNIYKEQAEELGNYIPDNGYLIKWAKQGVLMLNTVLTVREHEPGSHAGKGWETFTDSVIRKVDSLGRPVVFMLWGAPAQKKEALLKNPGHLVLKSAHPSPLSAYRGFFGCGHFTKCNEYLKSHGLEPIDWQIENNSGKGGQLSFL